jgi:hypothetical protein
MMAHLPAVRGRLLLPQAAEEARSCNGSPHRCEALSNHWPSHLAVMRRSAPEVNYAYPGNIEILMQVSTRAAEAKPLPR